MGNTEITTNPKERLEDMDLFKGVCVGKISETSEHSGIDVPEFSATEPDFINEFLDDVATRASKYKEMKKIGEDNQVLKKRKEYSAFKEESKKVEEYREWFNSEETKNLIKQVRESEEVVVGDEEN